MTLSELAALAPDDKIKAIIAQKVATNAANFLNQLNPLQHEILTNKAKYPDKLIKNDSGSSTVAIARLPLALQSQIVLYAATFLCGNPIEASCQPDGGPQDAMQKILNKVLKDAKVDYRDVEIAMKWMSETEVAELWYLNELTPDDPYWDGSEMAGAKFKLKMKVLAPSLGDTLYPVFDQSGDLIAFGRGYSLKDGDKTINYFDLYTADKIEYYIQGNSGYTENPDKPSTVNAIGKIPVIYHNRDKPEWADVQSLIERLEELVSKHADVNDYFGDPILLLFGEVLGWADKGEAAKTVKMHSTRDQQADARYLTWDSSPESKKLEFTNLKNFINDLTQTPPITFENMLGLGAVSGIALKMLFLSAHMKAAKNAGVFGEGIQRRYNFIMAALAVLNTKMSDGLSLDVRPKFKYFLPSDDTEVLNQITTAIAGGFMSKETGTELNPLIENPDAEKTRLKEEAATTLTDVNNEIQNENNG